MIVFYSILVAVRSQSTTNEVATTLTIFHFLKFKEKIQASCFSLPSSSPHIHHNSDFLQEKIKNIARIVCELMACYVPFNSRNLDISFFAFRPTVVYVDDLVECLKQFSSYTETLGCVHSSIFRSIHGNMVIHPSSRFLCYIIMLRLVFHYAVRVCRLYGMGHG